MKNLVFLIICLFLMLNGFGINAAVVPDMDTGNSSTLNPPVDEVPETEEIKNEVQYICSKVNSLSVRSGPTSSASVLGYLDKNDMAVFIDIENGWYKTVYKEKTAYVSSRYSELKNIEKTDEEIENALSFGATLLGYPYVYGSQRYHFGNGVLNKNFVNGKFDCSALVQYIYFISADVILDSTTRTQVVQGEYVEKSQIKRGDLLFFTNSSRENLSGIERIGHVAIYLGNNYILHTASDHAVIEPITAARWNYYITARRVL